MQINITSDWSNIKNELKRLKRIPSAKDKRKLDRVLHVGFLRTQARVHTITFSLKESGKENSIITGHTYRGVISYGGSSPGPNNPVDYAIYERNRSPHPGDPRDHNYMGATFMKGNYELHPLWVQAIKEILKG